MNSVNSGIYIKDKNGRTVTFEDLPKQEFNDLIKKIIEENGPDSLINWIYPIVEALQTSESYRQELQESIRNQIKRRTQGKSNDRF